MARRRRRRSRRCSGGSRSGPTPPHTPRPSPCSRPRSSSRRPRIRRRHPRRRSSRPSRGPTRDRDRRAAPSRPRARTAIAAARPVPIVSPGDWPAPTTIPTLPSSLIRSSPRLDCRAIEQSLPSEQRLVLELDPRRLEEPADHVVVAHEQDQLSCLARAVAFDDLLERLVGESHVPADLVGDAADQVALLVEAGDRLLGARSPRSPRRSRRRFGRVARAAPTRSPRRSHARPSAPRSRAAGHRGRSRARRSRAAGTAADGAGCPRPCGTRSAAGAWRGSRDARASSSSSVGSGISRRHPAPPCVLWASAAYTAASLALLSSRPVAPECVVRADPFVGDNRRTERQLAAQHGRGDDLGQLADLAFAIAPQ